MNKEFPSLAERIKNYVTEKNAQNIVVLDVEGHCSYADALVICEARSSKQAQTIASFLTSALKNEGIKALGVEGLDQGHWILIDFGDVVVHVFFAPVREFYDIEGVFPEAQKILTN